MRVRGKLRVYKEGPMLVFEMDNGVVKYDFATKTAYGLSGARVNDIKRQLAGYTLNDMVMGCDDCNYANYLKYIAFSQNNYNGVIIKNIGTMLSYVPMYAGLEQYFTAGLKNIDRNICYSYSFAQVPTNCIRICRKYELKLNASFVFGYIKDPNAYNLAFNLPYVTMTPKEVYELLVDSTVIRHIGEKEIRMTVLSFIEKYGYTMKSLMLYLDRIETLEALHAKEAFNLLNDTCGMMNKISPKFDRYPRYLKTTHDIVTRNYNRMKAEYNEAMFAKQIKAEMEHSIGGYAFIYPRSTQDIKDEAVQQNNCVAGYIERVIDGECDIVFMRNAKDMEHSLVTLEIRNGRVVQAKRAYNNEITNEQKAIIEKWQNWYQQKMVG